MTGLPCFGLPLLVVSVFVFSASCDEPVTQSATSKSYDLEVPGKSPIRIYEAEPLWGTTAHPTITEKQDQQKSQYRNFDSTTLKTRTNLNNPNNDQNSDEEAVTEFSALQLEEFLNKYSEKLVTKPHESEKFGTHPEEPRRRFSGVYSSDKRWDLISSQKHNHPFDDRKGWVSLEPVPWSVSKISKWQSKYKPQENDRPWYGNEPSNFNPYKYKPPRPTASYYSNDNDDDDFFKRKPSFGTSSFHAQKLQVQTNLEEPGNYFNNQRPQYVNQEEEAEESGGIITDGLPANFPESGNELPYRRQGAAQDSHPTTHPTNGDGEWVLLSTTKGYKYPKPKSRQRSLTVDGDSIGVHRSVRLTVLPPLKNSKVNMTTSHGGLLQVESTFQTVEEAQKQYFKKQKLKNRPRTTTKRPHRVLQPQQQPAEEDEDSQEPSPLAGTTVTTRNNAPDTSAVLAAVGAGMIPATMAMLLPMAMGGRRKRNVNVTNNPSTVEITLPRSL